MRHPGSFVLFTAWFCACASAPMPEETVAAIRFRQLIVTGGMDFIHGGGAWHDCIFLPDAKVIAQVVSESPPYWWKTRDANDYPRLYAYRTDEPPEPSTWPEDAKRQRPPEPVRISRHLADQIIATAEREERRRVEGLELGAKCVATGVGGGKDSVTGRHQ